MTRRELLAITPGMLLLNCSGDTKPKSADKPVEPVTGLHALYQMYTFARTWAQDMKVIRLTSLPIPEVKAVPGKAAAWQAQFASDTLGKARTYTFSVYEESVTIRQGIFADSSLALETDAHSFLLADAVTDSDQAWDISSTHGKKFSDEHPGMPISYILEGDHQTGSPVWRVIWGLSAASSSFSVIVDAHSGTFVRSLY